MSILKFIGCGAAFAPQYGNNSAFFKFNEKMRDKCTTKRSMFLIDCGSDVFSNIIKNNILYDVNGNLYIAITHFHSDHIGSLPDLLFYCYYVKNIKVYIMASTIDINPVKDEDLSCFVFKENMDNYLSICMSDTQQKYRIYNFNRNIKTEDGYSINVDLERHRNHVEEMLSYYVYIEFEYSNNKREYIVYSGDTTQIPPKPNKIKSECIELYIDCSSHSIDDGNNCHYYIGELLKNIMVKKSCISFSLAGIKTTVIIMHLDDITRIDSFISERKCNILNYPIMYDGETANKKFMVEPSKNIINNVNIPFDMYKKSSPPMPIDKQSILTIYEENNISGIKNCIVTLCGNIKENKILFNTVKSFLEKNNCIVLTPIFFNNDNRLPPIKSIHDLIYISSIIVVINRDGCYGEDTKEEIYYAINSNKSVIFLE